MNMYCTPLHQRTCTNPNVRLDTVYCRRVCRRRRALVSVSRLATAAALAAAPMAAAGADGVEMEDVHGNNILDSRGKPLYVGQRAMDRQSRLHEVAEVRLAAWQYHGYYHSVHTTSLQEVQLPRRLVRRKQGPRESRREQLRFRRRGEIRLVGHLEEQEGSPLGVSPFLDYFWVATGLLTCE